MVRQRGTVRVPSYQGGVAYALAVAATVLALLLLVTSAAAIFGEPETISPEGVRRLRATDRRRRARQRDRGVDRGRGGRAGGAGAVPPGRRPVGRCRDAFRSRRGLEQPSRGIRRARQRARGLDQLPDVEADPAVPVARVRASFRPKGGGFRTFPGRARGGRERGDLLPAAARGRRRRRARLDARDARGHHRAGGLPSQGRQLRPGTGSRPAAHSTPTWRSTSVATRSWSRPGRACGWSRPSSPEPVPSGLVQPISQGDGFTPRVATDEDSNAIAVWDTGGRIEASYPPAPGGSFGAASAALGSRSDRIRPRRRVRRRGRRDRLGRGRRHGIEDPDVTRTERGPSPRCRPLRVGRRGVRAAGGGGGRAPQSCGRATCACRERSGPSTKAFGAAQTLSEPRLDAFEPTRHGRRRQRVHGVDHRHEPGPGAERTADPVLLPAGCGQPSPSRHRCRTLGGSHSRPRIATDERSNALAVWIEDDEDGTDRSGPHSGRPASRSVSAVGTPLSPDGADASEPQVVFDERGNALVVWVRADPEGDGDSRVESSFRPRGGELRRGRADLERRGRRGRPSGCASRSTRARPPYGASSRDSSLRADGRLPAQGRQLRDTRWSCRRPARPDSSRTWRSTRAATRSSPGPRATCSRAVRRS